MSYWRSERRTESSDQRERTEDHWFAKWIPTSNDYDWQEPSWKASCLRWSVAYLLHFWLYDLANYIIYLQVFGAAICLLICQFHIIQAFMRYNDNDAPGHLRLSPELLAEVLRRFRTAQRCRDTPQSPWYIAKETFDQRVREACLEHGLPDAADWVIEYCANNWWCDEWLRKYTLENNPCYLMSNWLLCK